MTCAVSELQEALQKGNPLRDLSALRVSGRAKSAYSTWKKMEKKKLRFEEILDRLAIRVILDAPSAQRAEELCFEVRDILAKLWSLRPSKQKDYINHPKPNGYRSLHLIAERQGQPFEVQIRTEEMHRQAEYGACGHWEYKAGGSVAMTDAAAGAGEGIVQNDQLGLMLMGGGHGVLCLSSKRLIPLSGRKQPKSQGALVGESFQQPHVFPMKLATV